MDIYAEASRYADSSRDYLHMNLEHFTEELQLDNTEQVLKICESLSLTVLDESMRQLVQLPKVIRFFWILHLQQTLHPIKALL